MAREKNELELLACVVHVILAVFHWLAFVFNFRRRNVLDTFVHGAAGVYDSLSAIKHGKAATGELHEN
jgi:hypothetical protein